MRVPLGLSMRYPAWILTSTVLQSAAAVMMVPWVKGNGSISTVSPAISTFSELLKVMALPVWVQIMLTPSAITLRSFTLLKRRPELTR